MTKIYTTRGVVCTFLIVFLSSWATQALATSNPIPPPGQPRYLSLSIMNVESGDAYLSIMERAAAAGVNSFLINVNWEHIYSERGKPADWSQVDKEAELAQRLGCKIMLRVWVARHNDGDGWWPDNVRPVSGEGIRRNGLNGFSFSAPEAVAEANGFVRDVMEHFRPRQQAGQIPLVMVVANNTSEIGYSVDAFNPSNGKNELQMFDYSHYSKLAFREWVQRKYRTLAELNKAWFSDYSRFSDIDPPYIKGDVYSGNYGNKGMDWYLFRHSTLKSLIDGFVDTVKGVDKSYKYLNDMGSCYDGLSPLRATLGFKDLSSKTDGLKVNDHHEYPHRFAMDLLRSNLPGKFIGNELGRESGVDKQVWRDFINETYEHGADWMNLFGFDRPFNFPDIEDLIKETAAKWLRQPVQSIQTTQTVTYTLSEAIWQGTNAVQGRWRTEYNKTRKPIEVLLTEGALGNTPTQNQPPKVNQPIPDQQGKVGQPFNYEIPANTFTDSDGYVASLTARGLPGGIAQASWKLAGKPTASGTYNVTITARDNNGAEVSNQFKFTVTQEDAVNQPPKINQPIPDQRANAGQALDYEIPKATFTDPDGSVVGIVVEGLPAGLSLNGWKLTGKPSVSGTFSVTVRGRDNQGAETATQFMLTVAPAPTENVFSLFQAGNFLTRRFLRYIVDGDTLRGDETKWIVNILVSPKTGAVGSYSFKMEGPYSIGSTDNKAPYGVFGDNGGVVFMAGRYTLNVKSYEKADLKGTKLSDQTIRFVVIDDEADRNLPPVLVKSPAELFAKVGTPFTHRLPDSTFVDPDGVIGSFVITGLPDGLKGDGTLITGTPTKKGVFNPKVRVTDNSDGAAETTFRFTVSADNLPPVANAKIPDQTAAINLPFSYTIPGSVFTDPDGTIASVSILGLPDGMNNSGRTMSGTPAKAGNYQLVAVAKDNLGASTQLSFSLTVVAANRPPLVAKVIPNQVADSNAVYRFVIPAGTFIDPDGKIARLEMFGLPGGLDDRGDTISGRPFQVGEFDVKVRAFDDKGAVVETSFKFTVRGVNALPVAEAIPDVVAIVGQIFRFDVKQYFKDSDGAISSISYASALPPGVTANGSLLAGNPTAPGEYPIKVIARDNKGGSVTVEFMLRVERVELRIAMYQPGRVPRKIREVANADIIALSSLPANLDLYVESNADLSLMTFELTGPTSRKSTDAAAPFGLFDDAVGFVPAIGTYRLKVTAFRNNAVVSSRSIQFDIIRANNAPVRLGVEENDAFPIAELWKAYPNPFVNTVKVQMDKNVEPKVVELVTVEGRSTLLDHSKWRVESALLEVDLSEAATRTGIYLLRITGQDNQSRTLRIMKSEEK